MRISKPSIKIEKKHVAAGTIGAVGACLTAWHVATLTTTKVVGTAAAAGGGGTIAFNTVAAGLGAKIVVGALCLGATAVAAKLAYDHFDNRPSAKAIDTVLDKETVDGVVRTIRKHMK